MRISLNWLKEYVDISISPEALAEKLSLSGTAVDRITKRGEGIENVVVGQIESIEKHPDADRLSVAKVNVGAKKIQVVFGDKAVVRVGDKVPVAVAPARLPQGEIKHTAFRGVASEGMLSLMSELQEDLAPELKYFSKDTPLGQSVVKALGWDDIVLELAITPNRGDCLSVLGIAREVSALLHKPLKKQIGAVTYPIERYKNQHIRVNVQDVALCHKFCALYMEGFQVGPSPSWLSLRLQTIGVRSVNNIVDITNYVMFDLGEPLHAFDARTVADHFIQVRRAKKGEELMTLDGKTRALDPSMLVLADAKKALDVAGIMGGKDTEVTKDTKDIILVACVFSPSVIRRAYRHLGLRTEAAIRFEKGIDWYLREVALQKTAEMIQEIADGVVSGGIVRVSEKDPKPRVFDIKCDYINTLLGYSSTQKGVKTTLEGLGLKVSLRTKNVFTVSIPSWRHDLGIPADIAEEIGRMRDYNTIPAVPLLGAIVPPPANPLYTAKQTIRSLLISAGYNEIYTYSYYGAAEAAFMGRVQDHVEVANPISPNDRYLRRSLIPLLLRKASSNLRLFDDVSIFEIGAVFNHGAPLPKEDTTLALAFSLKGASTYELYRRLKGHIEHFGKGLGIDDFYYAKEDKGIVLRVENVRIGYIRVMTPEQEPEYKFRQNVAVFECKLAELLARASFRRRFKPIPLYPSVTRDLSFIVPDTARYRDILEIAKKSSPIISEIGLSDEFFLPDGRRSVTLRLVYSSLEKTLTGPEVDAVESSLVSSLTDTMHLELRK